MKHLLSYLIGATILSTACVTAQDSVVVISEIHYNPAGSTDDTEFVEIHNLFSVDVDLSNWALTGAVEFDFPSGTTIPAGGYLVVARNPSALQTATGHASAMGPWTGALNNGGEKIILTTDAVGARVMDEVDYSDDGQWPAQPDGSGATLEKKSPNLPSRLASSWTWSQAPNGTPGSARAAIAIPSVVINEIAGAADNPFFIELYNNGTTPINLNNYVLASNNTENADVTLSLGTLAAGNHATIDASTLGYTPADEERLFLFTPSKAIVVDTVRQGNNPKARFPDGAEGYSRPATTTPGAANSISVNQDIVINEILYNGYPDPGTSGVPASFADTTVIPYFSNWRYENTGTGQTAGWANSAHNSWATGTAGFGNESTVASVASTDVPKNVGNTGGSQGISVLNVSGLPQVINDVNVRLNISHTWNSDLDVFLIAPDGTRVELFTDVGGSGDNFDNTLLDSQAGTAITAVGAPFNGTFRPEGDLNVLNGKNPNGQWRLEVTNDNGSFRFRRGTINSWSLDFTTPSLIGTNLFNSGQVTYYFEREFNFTGNTQDAQIRITHKIDDGAVFYLNGVELSQRFNMPAGAVTSSTLAASSIEFSEQVITIPASGLISGQNRFSVEVHQGTVNSSDLLFDAQVEIREQTSPAIPPTPFVESNEEWIELYNKGTTTVNLGGWELDDAVDFEFDANTSLAPGDYLVIARDPVALAQKYPGITIVGPWSGSLSNRGERIQLEDNNGNTVDEVRYFDGGRWHDFADGGGCSLELKDPRSDNSLPESWAPSVTNAGWNTYTYRAVATNNGFGKNNFHELILGTLDSSEFLIDDISVIEDPDGAAIQFIQNGNFSNDTVGSAPANWRLAGNHGLHGRTLVVDDGGNKVLKLVSTGASREYHNHLQTTFANSQQVVEGREYEIKYRAKWLKGNNKINTRLFTDWLSNTQVIDASDNWGTPGTANSAAVTNFGPTFSDLSHSPTIPNANQDVTVSITAEDPDNINSLTLRYRRDNATNFSSVAMTHQGGGIYQGTIPGGSAGSLAQFYIDATDAHPTAAATSSFPADGPDSGAFIQWQDNEANTATLRNLRLMIRPSHRETMYLPFQRMSNYRFPATLVINENEVYYDIGARLKGSASGRFHETANGFNLGFDNMQLFDGVHKSIAIERAINTREMQQQMMSLHLMNNAGGGISHMYFDPIRLLFPSDTLNNLSKTGFALIMPARYSSAWRRSQFENGSSGTIYNLELLYNPLETTGEYKNSFPWDHENGAYEFADLPLGKETYRWGFQIRSNQHRDNYEPLINTAKAVGLGGSSAVAEAAKHIDVNQWARTWAWIGLVGNDDIYGRAFDHNFRMFHRISDDKLVALPWDLDRAFQLSTNSSLFPGNNLGSYLQQPTVRRLFMQHVHNLCQTSFTSSYATPWASHLAAKSGLNFSSFPGYINNRCNFANSQLPANVNFAITTNNGNNFTVNASNTTLQGDGWIDVATIQINGVETDVTWLDDDTWQLNVPLAQGANPITLTAYNLENNQVGTDSVTITNSSTTDLASPTNLVLTEMMYHPVDPSVAEQTAGFTDDDDFEYIELLNTSSSSIDLSGCTFTDGITYTFPAGTILNGNARIVIARNLAAFAQRYGSISQTLVGPYTGRLDNGGETLTLAAANTNVIFSVTYGDSGEWSEDADGNGYTLVNLFPTSGTNLDLPANWSPSRNNNGLPGNADLYTYPAWLTTYPALTAAGEDGENDDFDKDGFNNLTEFALNSDPTNSGSTPALPVTVERINPGTGEASYLLYSCTTPIAAPGLAISPESSRTLNNDWQTTPETVEASFHTRTRNLDGTETLTYRSSSPISNTNPLWLRFRIEQQSNP